MKKTLSLLGLYLFATIIMVENMSHASELPTFTKLKQDKLQRVTDNNTFWKKYNLDRIYFAPDKSFTQQLNNPEGSSTPGTILRGTWAIKDDLVCWTYANSEQENNLNVSNTDFCYSVYSDAPNDTFMTTHAEEFILYQTINGVEERSPSFKWNRWAYDNYVIDPSYVSMAQKGLDTMKEYRYTKTIPGGTIDRSKLNDRMKSYYDEVIGKIFFIGDNLMYFHKNGGYFSTSETRIENADRDISFLTAPVRFGQWSMKDNIHCYGRSESSSVNCEFVFPFKKGLVREYDGTLGMHRNGFTRVHGEMAVGHILPSESSFPELFKRVDEIFEQQK